MKHKKRHILRKILILLVLIIAGLVVYYNWVTRITPPEIKDRKTLEQEVVQRDADTRIIDSHNWLRHTRSGLWEMHLQGHPFDIGVYNGKLTKELIKKQEVAFVEQINQIVPSKNYLKFLKYFIGWFNRDIDRHIPEEYLDEIYGISFSCSHEFDFISPPYERMLNYHAAHDIGHALKDLALVGCTSFAVNMNSDSNNLLIGRNFDFYINDDFAENKIVVFVQPDSGYRFMYVTWASMMGVVSGMNEKGLTVTINAAKSDIPTKAAMPISILTREILQYASNFDEAIAIANKRQTFVSESILVGSAENNSALVIEKSPTKTGIYKTPNNYLVSSNHFQSETFARDKSNLENIAQSASFYREQRCEQLILGFDTLNYPQTASILRNPYGLDNRNIGIGNEKAMAQMISHHSVIFEPEKLIVWVSTHPWQLGKYVAYHLDQIFQLDTVPGENTCLNDTSLTIPDDPFMQTTTFDNFLLFRKWKKVITTYIKKKETIQNADPFLQDFVMLNPEYYYGYKLAGDYFAMKGKPEAALKYYRKALTKVVDTKPNAENIKKQIRKMEHDISH
jgi:tetratricopeptide (TPR) repeat protein